MMAESFNYIVQHEGRNYRITSDRALTPDQQRAMVLRGVAQSAPPIPETGQGPSLTAGPYPGTSRPAPPADTRPEMPFLARAPLEMGLPLAAGLAAGSLSGAAAPATVPLAAGGAQALGSELNRRVVAEMLGYAPPPPAFSHDPQRETALQFGTGAAGEFVPGAVSMLARRLFAGPTPPTASRTLQAFRETGVQPKMTDLAEGRAPAMMESFARQTVTGAPIIDKAMRTQAERLTQAAADFNTSLGPLSAQSEQAVGQGVKKSIMAGLERGQGIENQLWQDFRAMAPAAQVTPIRMVQWAEDVISRADEGLRTTQDSSSIKLAQEILRKSFVGGKMQSVPLDQIDLWRQDVGRTLTKPELISGFDQGRLRHLYGALMDDAETGIQYTGNQALMNKWQEVRGFSRNLIDLYRNSTVADIVDLTPEKIMSQLTGNRGVTELRQWKAAILGEIDPRMGPDLNQQKTWDMARRHIFESILGETTHGTGKAVEVGIRGLSQTTIDGRKLRMAVNRLGDDVLHELLAPDERRALANIGIVSDAIVRGGRTGAVPYTSITGQNIGIQALLANIGGLAGLSIGGGPAASAGIVASLATPAIMAKLLTSPKAVDIFASPGFAKLALEFNKRALSREGAATMVRLIGMLQEAEPSGQLAAP